MLVSMLAVLQSRQGRFQVRLVTRSLGSAFESCGWTRLRKITDNSGGAEQATSGRQRERERAAAK